MSVNLAHRSLAALGTESVTVFKTNNTDGFCRPRSPARSHPMPVTLRSPILLQIPGLRSVLSISQQGSLSMCRSPDLLTQGASA